MHLEPYSLDELTFAYCCHVYYRWHTHYRKPFNGLTEITPELIEDLREDIRILQLQTTDVDVAMLASLRPTDSISIGASKIKGAASKIVRQLDSVDKTQKILGTGYFACTVGPRTSSELEAYLDGQGEHHGYASRAIPPTFVRDWPQSEFDDLGLQANHSHVLARWHLVFATWNRQGVFSKKAAQAIADRWCDVVHPRKTQLIKASFVPDHVHLAIRTHPTVVPANLVPQLLNTSQALIRDEFADHLFAAGIPRLWKPSAYIGTYGDLSNRQIKAYLRGWEEKGGGPSGSSTRHPRRLPARYLRLARYEQAATPTRDIPAACRRGT